MCFEQLWFELKASSGFHYAFTWSFIFDLAMRSSMPLFAKFFLYKLYINNNIKVLTRNARGRIPIYGIG